MSIDSCENHGKFSVHCRACSKAVEKGIYKPEPMSLNVFKRYVKERIASVDQQIERLTDERNELREQFLMKKQEIFTLQKHHYSLLHIQMRIPNK